MALDFTILNDARRSIDSVPIGVDEHWKLFGNLPPDEWPLLSRLADYYSDAVFPVETLDDLCVEINALCAGKPDSDRKLLQKLQEVIDKARKIGRPIEVQAD